MISLWFSERLKKSHGNTVSIQLQPVFVVTVVCPCPMNPRPPFKADPFQHHLSGEASFAKAGSFKRQPSTTQIPLLCLHTHTTRERIDDNWFWTASQPWRLCTDETRVGRRKAQENLCESRGGRAGLPVPNKPDGFCGRKATLEEEEARSCVKVEVAVLGSRP